MSRPIKTFALLVLAGCGPGSLEFTGLDFGAVRSAVWIDFTAAGDREHKFVATNQRGFCNRYRELAEAMSEIDARPVDSEQGECERTRDLALLFEDLVFVEGASYFSFGFYIEDGDAGVPPPGGAYPRGQDEVYDPRLLQVAASSYGEFDVASLDCSGPEWRATLQGAASPDSLDFFGVEVGATEVAAFDQRYDIRFDGYQVSHPDGSLGGTLSGQLRFDRCEVVIDEDVDPGF